MKNYLNVITVRVKSKNRWRGFLLCQFKSGYFYPLLMLLLCFTGSRLFAQSANKIFYTFTEQDSSYIFHGKFLVKADALCALNMCFEKEHLEALADEGKEIDLVKNGENWNLLRYTFKKFGVFENKTTWLRTIYPDKNRVTFKLVNCKNSHSIMPKIITGEGYYVATKSGDYIQFEYYSKCTLSKVALTGLLIKFAKKGAVDFMKRLKSYIEINCKKN